MHVEKNEENSDIWDVVIIGAGLSGIGTAYWLQKKCPTKKIILLESRLNPGGTWDLFRYPGIRSDSDMFTFGFRFKPWKNPTSLSEGSAILSYLKETITENGIDKKIRYGHTLISADWSDKDYTWNLTVKEEGQSRMIKTRFLYMCSGYYSYEEAYKPTISGESDFKGIQVQPQFWPEGLDYSQKKIVVIGSGATAVTLVPAMTAEAAHVTMLQRSPTYIMNLPNNDRLFSWMKKWLPEKMAYRITRRRNIILGIVLFGVSRLFPQFVKRLIMKGAARQLPTGFETEKHFNPKYNPWDQRLCVVPDGDFFAALRSGKASVVTDEIDRITETGILLKSGEELNAEILVWATGLKIKLLGGARFSRNGHSVSPNETMVYKGMMISQAPNLAIAFGYTNASWTLKTDLTANYVCKLLNYMDKKGYVAVEPQKETDVISEPFLNLSSGYIQRAQDLLPKQGSRRPWRVYQNYLMDMFTTRFGKLNDGVLKFSKP
jgi:monooxygenase